MIKKILIIPYKFEKGRVLYFVAKRPTRDGWWQFPTGHVGDTVRDEDTVSAAKRELKEELGIDGYRNFINSGRSFSFKLEPDDDRIKGSTGRNVQEFIFAVELPRHKIKLEKREFSSYRFLTQGEAQKILKWPQHKIELKKIDQMIKAKSFPKIFTLSGPGASGKETILNEITRILKIKRAKTVTTRPRGDDEVSPGRDFITKKQFDQIDKRGGFVEKNLFKNYWYGSLKREVEDQIEQGKDVVIEIDLNGVRSYRKKYSNLVAIFLKVDLDKLAARLERRGRDNLDSIKKRMKISRHELKNSHICDYVVVNEEGKLDKAVKKTIQIISKNKGAIYEK